MNTEMRFEKYINFPNIVLLVNSVLLFLATGGHPYSFYSTLRWIVFGSMIYMVYYKMESDINKLVIPVYVITGVVFNPVIPVYLNRADWYWIDIVAGVLLLVTIVFNREE